MSDLMTDRYGAPSRTRRRAVVAVSGVVGVLALAWLVWAVWAQSTPQVQSAMRGFTVVDAHTVRAEVSVKTRSSDTQGSCLLRAYGEDHSVVGELNFRVTDATSPVVRRESLRTEREATSVELIGCTAPGQNRPH